MNDIRSRRDRSVSLLLLIAVVCLVAMVPESYSQSTNAPPKQSDSQILSHKQGLFLDYSQDFLEFAKVHKDEGIEYDTAMDLHMVAATMYQRIDAAHAMMLMYEMTTCKDDRILLASILKEQLRSYSQETDLDTKQANFDLAYVKSTATVQLGLRMKDDLRSMKETFDTMHGSLP